ncbi:hypothetical protein LB533_04410 [Mesorhizobium sp. BR1-1-13]|uniref:hypothetical protein n=1 Tax=Mesorhizobium sp. BR1-1-13 TaxID=2876656 RepID=UPI001CD0C276|nr:hypothetical protein [Mesorhizobium sp. BR1-1-13]MBZ9940342.1 hypothetical protein [Mesorhizobium sp. BR1-1-13]
MRTIDVSVDVFALIWSRRQDGEETEDQILRRILAGGMRENPPNREVGARHVITSTNSGVTANSKWWEVIEYSLVRLGGESSLGEIYKTVEQISNEIGKRTPPSLEAAIRGTLEDNSSDSDRYKEVRDVFAMPRGKHAGYWSLRNRKR